MIGIRTNTLLKDSRLYGNKLSLNRFSRMKCGFGNPLLK